MPVAPVHGKVQQGTVIAGSEIVLSGPIFWAGTEAGVATALRMEVVALFLAQPEASSLVASAPVSVKLDDHAVTTWNATLRTDTDAWTPGRAVATAVVHVTFEGDDPRFHYELWAEGIELE